MLKPGQESSKRRKAENSVTPPNWGRSTSLAYSVGKASAFSLPPRDPTKRITETSHVRKVSDVMQRELEK
jgi:hypothetical protein